MIPTFNHSLLTSFYLFLDNQLCGVGQAYQNINTGLFPMVAQSATGYVYASPFKEWVADSCISGAVVPSGVWTSSGQFLTRNSGISIDFVNGRILSQFNWGQLSGSFSRKEYNIYTSTEGYVDWWLERVFGENKNITYTPTGIPDGPFAAPCIILTNAREHNDPWALGGLDNTQNTIRGYIISPSNSPYLQEGVNSLCRDMALQWMSLVGVGNMPYLSNGDLKPQYATGGFCYSNLCQQFGPAGVYIESSYEVRVNQRINNATSFNISVAEWDLSTIREPRLSK